MYAITNTSKGPRGIWSRGRLVWLKPGETRTFMPDDPAGVQRNRDLDAEVVGDLPDPPANLIPSLDEVLSAKVVEPAEGKKPAGAKRKRTPARRKSTRRAKASK